MENVRNHRDIKLVTNEAKRNYLVSELKLSYNKFFFRKFASHTNKKEKKL